MALVKSSGFTQTEKLLSELCDSTFLKIWSYPNPWKSDGKELCDLLAVFENHIFLFFDRESNKFENKDGSVDIQWSRWEKEVIQKQVKTSEGAKRYILQNPSKVYLDATCQTPFPIPIPFEKVVVHRIIVAHGAADACKRNSPSNIYGSLGIGYVPQDFSPPSTPFMVYLDKSDPVHVFDSFNLSIVLEELSTVKDFTDYLVSKEAVANEMQMLVYCGEEDLLAHYFTNFNSKTNKYEIGKLDKGEKRALYIEEGLWQRYSNSKPYKTRRIANDTSRLWDDLLQRTCENALNETVKGNGDVFKGRSAVFEMAKEPRFMRRVLSQRIREAIESFPGAKTELVYYLSLMPSFYPNKLYVFMQLHDPNIKDYDNEYRPIRQTMLEIACGVAKNKYLHMEQIIGIAIDAPKHRTLNSEDFILINAKEWTAEDIREYDELNKDFKFLNSANLKQQIVNIKDFPVGPSNQFKEVKIGRNDLCPCGSERKYKKCCLNNR